MNLEKFVGLIFVILMGLIVFIFISMLPSLNLISHVTSALGFIPFSISIIVTSSAPVIFNFFRSKPSLNCNGKTPIPTKFDL